MRLLKQTQDGQLAFTPDEQPNDPYVILSHTWGQEEVSYEDVCSRNLDKTGYRKIQFCLQQAARDNLTYCWIDSCCIDKRDRNELGEALNRMWVWYARAAVCYVYLTDVSTLRDFRESRWFTRGWTLQELLAPRNLRFYTVDGEFLGDRGSLFHDILAASGINTRIALRKIPLAERFRWSLNRQTTKPEDASYCMLGLLEVEGKLMFNYGEDGESARNRLFDAVAKEHGQRAVREMRHMLTARMERLATVEEMTLAALLQDLEFSAEYRRWQAISDPYPQTCTWILSHPDFVRWTTGEAKMLWIKGKAGSGKSTLMKSIQLKSSATPISFYFNARGDILEHSTLGMYRSLLSQLLRKPALGDQVLAHINKQVQGGIRWAMTIPNLQSTLRFAIGLLQQPVQCFVDALDECDRREIQEMVEFFEDMTGEFFHVCFASRYYPAIVIKRSIAISLEKQEHSDIALFVHGRLAVEDDHLGLAEQVISKANGVFFWAVLVVRLLNDALGNGTMYQVEQRLHSLPDRIEELLRDIMLNNPDDEVVRFRHCLYWLLFSREPLKPKEFYLAIITGLCKEGHGYDTEYTSAWKNISDAHLERFVSSCSRGLAEITADQTVQVIHESVRDFLLHHQGLKKLHPGIDADISSLGHDHLKQTCLRYLSIPAVRKILSKDEETACTAAHECHPFLTYASRNAIYHADEAADSIDQSDFLRNQDFIKTHAIFCDRHPVRFNNDWDLTLCLVDHNAGRLIRAAHKLDIPMNSRVTSTLAYSLNTRTGMGIAESMLGASPEAFQALLDCGANLNSTYQGLTALNEAAGFFPSEYAVRELLDRGADPDVLDLYGRNCLMLAVAAGNVAVARLLLDHGINLHAKCRSGHTALYHLIRSRSYGTDEATPDNNAGQDVVLHESTALVSRSLGGERYHMAKLLLDRGAHADAGGTTGSPLSVSCERYDIEMIELLLNYGAKVDIKNETELTPLLELVVGDNERSWPLRLKVMKILLSYGANTELRDSSKNTALLKVCKSTKPIVIEEGVELLLANGANAAAVDDLGQTPLESLWRLRYDNGLNFDTDPVPKPIRLLLEAHPYVPNPEDKRAYYRDDWGYDHAMRSIRARMLGDTEPMQLDLVPITLPTDMPEEWTSMLSSMPTTFTSNFGPPGSVDTTLGMQSMQL